MQLRQYLEGQLSGPVLQDLLQVLLQHHSQDTPQDSLAALADARNRDLLLCVATLGLTRCW